MVLIWPLGQSSIGAMLIGVIVSAVLHGITLLQAFMYWKSTTISRHWSYRSGKLTGLKISGGMLGIWRQWYVISIHILSICLSSSTLIGYNNGVLRCYPPSSHIGCRLVRESYVIAHLWFIAHHASVSLRDYTLSVSFLDLSTSYLILTNTRQYLWQPSSPHMASSGGYRRDFT